MANLNSVQEPVSTEKIIENIKMVRDSMITDILQDMSFSLFLENHFQVLAISAIKTEFIKRSLKELRDSSLDLDYYSSLIKQMRELPHTVVQDHVMITKELMNIFERFGVGTSASNP